MIWNSQIPEEIVPLSLHEAGSLGTVPMVRFCTGKRHWLARIPTAYLVLHLVFLNDRQESGLVCCD